MAALGTAAAAGAGFLIYKAATSAQGASVVPSPFETGPSPSPVMNTGIPSATLPPGNGMPAIQYYDANGQPIAPSAVVNRLRTSDSARQAFALQALIYSTHTSDQVPDGIASTARSELADLAGIAVPVGSVSATLSPASLAQVRQYLFSQNPGQTLRFLPFALPQDVIDSVNATAAAIDSSAIQLQALPQGSTVSAGEALRPAG